MHGREWVRSRPIQETLGTKGYHYNASLTVLTFKIPEQDHPKVNSRRNTGPPFLRLVGFTELLDEVIEATLIENLIEFLVEGVRLRANYLIGCNEQFLFFRFPLAENHAGILP